MGGGGGVHERGDICVLKVDAWQKPTRYCKAIILQLKIDKLKKKTPRRDIVSAYTYFQFSDECRTLSQ